MQQRVFYSRAILGMAALLGAGLAGPALGETLIRVVYETPYGENDYPGYPSQVVAHSDWDGFGTQCAVTVNQGTLSTTSASADIAPADAIIAWNTVNEDGYEHSIDYEYYGTICGSMVFDARNSDPSQASCSASAHAYMDFYLSCTSACGTESFSDSTEFDTTSADAVEPEVKTVSCVIGGGGKTIMDSQTVTGRSVSMSMWHSTDASAGIQNSARKSRAEANSMISANSGMTIIN